MMRIGVAVMMCSVAGTVFGTDAVRADETVAAEHPATPPAAAANPAAPAQAALEPEAPAPTAEPEAAAEPAPAAAASPAKPSPVAGAPTPVSEPAHKEGREDQVTTDQSLDAFTALEDAQAGPPGVFEVRARLTFGYVPAEGYTPADELEFSLTPAQLPTSEFLIAQYFEHDDVDNTTGILFGWNQRWVKDGGHNSVIPSVGTLTEYFLRTPVVAGLAQFAPGSTGGDHVGETLTLAKYLGPGTAYLNGVVERRLFNTQICTDANDNAYQPSDPRADQSPLPPQQDGCDYWADWAFAARLGYKLPIITEVLDLVASYWIETNEFTTQTKSLTYPNPENQLPYDIAELAVIWHANEHFTISPGVQVGLDGRAETPTYEAGVFFLYE